jgi:hypothetical protein
MCAADLSRGREGPTALPAHGTTTADGGEKGELSRSPFRNGRHGGFPRYPAGESSLGRCP